MKDHRVYPRAEGIGRLVNAALTILLAVIVVPARGDSVITTFAGTGKGGFSGDGAAASQADLRLNLPNGTGGASFGGGLAFDNAGNLFISDVFNNRIRKVDASTNVISTVAGSGQATHGADGGPLLQTGVAKPTQVAIDLQGNVYFTEWTHPNFDDLSQFQSIIRRIDPSGTISTIIGGGDQTPAEGIAATDARIGFSSGIVTDRSGNSYLAEVHQDQARIFRIDPQGIVHVFAGGGTLSGAKADGMPATKARLQFISGTGGNAYLVIDQDGSIYFTEMGTNTVRKIDPNGVIQTVAHVTDPSQLAIDTQGSLFVTSWPNKVYKISLNPDGTRSTSVVVGLNPTSKSDLGDGGPAQQGALSYPCSLAIDGSGSLYIDDALHNRIRKVERAAAPGLVMGVPFPSPVVPGDLNGDNQVTLADATLALQIAIGAVIPTPTQLRAGDLQGEGKIDTADVTRILFIALGLTTVAHASPAQPDPRLFAPDSSPYGKPYASWIAEDRRRQWEIPVATNPFLGSNGPDAQQICKMEQPEPVWFYDAMPSPDIPNVWTLPCPVPAGKAILLSFAVSGSVNSPDPMNAANLPDGKLVETAEQNVNRLVPVGRYRKMTLDGAPIDIDAYRLSSGLITTKLPSGAILGYPSGTANGAIAGDFVILQPPSVGEHVIEDNVVILGVPRTFFQVLRVVPGGSK